MHTDFIKTSTTTPTINVTSTSKSIANATEHTDSGSTANTSISKGTNKSLDANYLYILIIIFYILKDS